MDPRLLFLVFRATQTKQHRSVDEVRFSLTLPTVQGRRHVFFIDPMSASTPPLRDARGLAVSGATTAALEPYERAVAAFVSWRLGVEPALERALDEAPRFVMAIVLQAWLRACGRDLQRLRSVRPLLERAAHCPMNARERAHVAALLTLLGDDYEGAKACLAELLRHDPLDLVALHAAHNLDYLTGDVDQLHDRIAAALPAWSDALPGHGAVVVMQAFGLVERGDVARGERYAQRALAKDAFNARAHHVMAHVCEAAERPAEGVRWLRDHAGAWKGVSAVSMHCSWHLALFELALGRTERALEVYDGTLRDRGSREVADLIDASALLWRLHLAGVDAGTRWRELAEAWAPRIDDRHCTFSDVHAMFAFVGARDELRTRGLEQTLAKQQACATRHGATTRTLGLPACRALIAYGQGQHALASTLLADLPPLAHRLGGSQAQRDVLRLTLQAARGRLAQPAGVAIRRRRLHARSTSNAMAMATTMLASASQA